MYYHSFFPHLCTASRAKLSASKVYIRKCGCQGEFGTYQLKICNGLTDHKSFYVLHNTGLHYVYKYSRHRKEFPWFWVLILPSVLTAVFPDGKIKCRYPLLPANHVKKQDLLKCLCSKTNQHSEWSDVGVR